KVLPAGAAEQFQKLKSEVLAADDALEGIKLRLSAVADAIRDAQIQEDLFTKGLTDWNQLLKSVSSEGLGDTDKALAELDERFKDLKRDLLLAADAAGITGDKVQHA